MVLTGEHAGDRRDGRRNRWSTAARCPPRAVVIPGSRPRTFPAGEYGLPCGLIIGYRTEGTDDKVRLNELLRDFGVSMS